MSITFEPASTEDHFEQILQLQKQYLRQDLSEAEQCQQGFVPIRHSLPLLKRLAQELPQMVALQDGRVIGYNLAVSPSLKPEVPSLMPLMTSMFQAFEETLYQGRLLNTYSFIIGGQVCC